jgi:leucyl aminopeptidase (aminopeptidase T)
MKEILMMKGARKLVEVCGNVQAGEKVLVLSDFAKASIAQAVAAAAHQRNAEVVISMMPPRKMHNEPLPEIVAQAMRKADIIFAPTSWSIAHTEARVEATKAGVRIINMPSYQEETLISGGIDVDFEKQAPLVEKVAQILTQAKIARLYTPLGTNITLNLEGRSGAALTGLAHKPGVFCTPPDIEARITPVEGTSEGVVVVDGSIPVPEIGVILEPIRVTVQKGNVTKIDGGKQAQLFSDILANAKDPGAYNIAELGIGLNHMAKIIGVMVEDEGSLGTVHIGVGTSAAFGGKVRTQLHLDMMIRQPTLELDGKVLLEKGSLKIG